MLDYIRGPNPEGRERGDVTAREQILLSNARAILRADRPTAPSPPPAASQRAAQPHMECLAHSHLAGMRLPLGRGTPAQALEFARIARRRLQTISQREGINLSTSLPPPRPLEFWRTFIVAWISTATASSHRTGAQRSRALGSGLVFQPDGQLERFGLRRPRPLGFLCGSRGAHLRCHPATSSYSSRSSGCSLLAAFSLQKSRTINVTGSAAPAPRTPAGQSSARDRDGRVARAARRRRASSWSWRGRLGS